MFLAFAESRKVLPDNTLGSLLSGAIAGLVTSLVSTPCDWVKIQQQTRGGSVANLAIVGEALRAGGPSRLFTGHFMNMGREGVYTAFYLGLFDAIKKVILGDDRLQQGERLPIHLVAAASASTGAIAWVASYPFDVIKSVQQAQPAHAPWPPKHHPRGRRVYLALRRLEGPSTEASARALCVRSSSHLRVSWRTSR